MQIDAHDTYLFAPPKKNPKKFTDFPEIILTYNFLKIRFMIDHRHKSGVIFHYG